MKTEAREQKLIEIFQCEKVLGLGIVKEIIGTKSRMTVFRQLKALGYYSSYSHAGKYYTLCSIPVFDRNGLWSYGGIHFSKHGNLMETIPVLVKRSEAGYFAAELEELLNVFVHNAVGKLFKLGRLLREQIGDQYLYLAPVLAESQFAASKAILTQATAEAVAVTDSDGQELIEHFETFFSVLNEKQRRLYLGLESIRLGHGGDVRMASIAGVNVKTVSRGRRELLSKQIDLDRIRRKGAGRPTLKKTKL
jgi:hypothetical protein